MVSHKQATRAIITAIAVLTALYLFMCYLDCQSTNVRQSEGFQDNNNGGNASIASDTSMIVRDVAIMDTLFPSRYYPVSLAESGVIAHYNNLDTELVFRFTISDAPDILANTLITFHDVKNKKPDIVWTVSKWQPISTRAPDVNSSRVFELKQYLEPNTTYRVHVQVDGRKLSGPGLNNPIIVGKQHFRALGVETQPVDRNTDPSHGGPLDGNMGLALLINDTTRQESVDKMETIPGGNIQLGQIQMIPYNQALFHVRVPDIRVFHQLVQRHVSKLSGELPSDKLNIVLNGLLEYVPWKLEANVIELTADGNRPLTEEELDERDKYMRQNRLRVPRVRVEPGNPSICVDPEKSPTGPCPIRLVGVQPGRYYRVTVHAVFNQLDTTNNYRRTHPLTFTFQAIDITGSASLMSGSTVGSPSGIANAIEEVGVKLDEFKKRQSIQDQQLDELDNMYNGITLV